MKLQISEARFVKSAPSLAEAPDLGGSPEIVLAGRSNVGKSSFINAVLGRKGLAKTSNTPGKTRLINFYQVGGVGGDPGTCPGAWAFVDLPGYGYAKVSKTEQEQWKGRLEAFLLGRPEIRCVFLLIDARHAPKPSDILMRDWLAYHRLPYRMVLTKADKLSKNALTKQIQQAAEVLGIPAETIILFSATEKTGHAEISRILAEIIAG